MNRLFSKKSLPKGLIRLEISTPLASKAILPGQYMVVRTEPGEAGVLLPVIKADADKGTLWSIVSPCGESNNKVTMMPSGSVFNAVEGPYGIPLPIHCLGTVLCVADQKGIIPLLPVINSLRKAGNRVVALLTAASPDQLLLEDEVKVLADELIINTKEDSPGLPVSLEQAVARTLRNHSVQGVFVAGSARTIRDTCSQTINHPIATQALLVDTPPGKSVHGMFRVSICGNVRSVCVDGHDFNAYYATFDEMVRRFEHGAKEKQPVAPAL